MMRFAIVAALAGVLGAQQAPAPSAAASPQGATPTACLAEVRAFAQQRQVEMRAALPQLGQSPSPELLAEYQAALSKLSVQNTQDRNALAKACAAKFDAKTVADRELSSLVDLYADAGQPELAAAAMTRALALTSLPEAERAAVLVQAIRVGLREPKGDARNARLEQYVDELDRMSAAVIQQKFDAHSAMNGFYRFDDIDAGIIKHSTWLIETGKSCDPALRVKYGSTISSAYVNMAEAWAGQGMNDQAIELMERGIKDLADLKNVTNYISSVLPRYKLVGTPGAPIAAPRWLNAPAGTASIAMPGNVTLLEFTAHWCGPCKESYPGIKRMLAKYAPKGFRVVMVTELYGYFETERNLTADQEFERDRAYFKKEGMDVPIAVGGRSSEMVNGKPVYKRNPNDEAYRVGGIPQIHLIDRQGRIRLIMVGYDDANESKLAKIIEGLLAEK